MPKPEKVAAQASLPPALFGAMYPDLGWVIPQAGAWASLQDLEAEGFPVAINKVFLNTADAQQCVVMSRAPGGASTGLIADGYDLKGYQIKAKSCNWGPAAGFLCQLTALNKKGAEKIDYNDGHYAHYFEYRRDHQIAGHPFLQLMLSDTRKDYLLNDSIDGNKIIPNGSVIKVGDDVILGVAHDAAQSVVFEFMLKKQGSLWAVYHRNVFVKAPEESVFTDFIKNEEMSTFDDKSSTVVKRLAELIVKDQITRHEKPAGKQVKPIVAPESAPLPAPEKASELGEKLAKAGVTLTGVLTEHFYPLLVAQNPYPPYVDRSTAKHKDEGFDPTQVYKNAVTGDYDLFAVWPQAPTVGFRELPRLSETGKLNSLASPIADTAMFMPVPSKPFASQLWAAENVYIEIIPGFTEIEALGESPEFGNINAAVAFVVQSLNSAMLLAVGQGRGGHLPNLAFHSDEGGRPGIDEIDYPFAVYLPKTLFDALVSEAKADGDAQKKQGKPQRFTLPPGRQLLIKDPLDFLDLAFMLKRHCYVLFNHVWFMHIFALIHENLASVKNTITSSKTDSGKKTKEVKERTKWIDDRLAERDKLGAEKRKVMKQRLARLFVKAHLADRQQENIAMHKLQSLATTFVKFAVTDEYPTAGEMVVALRKHQIPNLTTPPAEQHG